MGIEIERKFLVNKDKWLQAEKGTGTFYRQGYLLTDPDKTIRVRISDTRGFITIKGKTEGASRLEFEYEIPQEEAASLLHHFAESDVTKVRYKVMAGGKLWEVDEFEGANNGLILAEIELQNEDELFELPEWVTREVTEDSRYYNSYLSQHPFNSW